VPVNVAHLKKVLIAIDFSEESKKALCYGTAFARLFGASLIALHIVEEISCQADYGYGPVTRHIPNQSALRRSRTQLIRLGKKLVGSDVKLTAMTDSGSAHAEIVKVAKKLDVDLIIMGTRGICANEHTSLGSTAQKVVRDAPCPVLVVRRKQHEFVSRPKV
jgi:nucleotide-binding universal stress UspA family protein